MNELISRLLAFRTAEPEDLVNTLHGLYMQVFSLDDDGLVAAYQTVMTLQESSATPEHPAFKRVRQAIINQMQQEIFRYLENSPLRLERHERFQRITGEALLFFPD